MLLLGQWAPAWTIGFKAHLAQRFGENVLAASFSEDPPAFIYIWDGDTPET